MSEKLCSLINKSLLWQSSTEPFLDDAHLDPELDVAIRKIIFE